MQQVHPWHDHDTGASARRFRVDVHLRASQASSIASDVREGLGRSPKSLPPKYFYDTRGSALFEQICATQEYYPTRTEAALLEAAADSIVETTQPTHVVELGSGSARKTRALLDAAERSFTICRYVPFDVSESMLRQSSEALLSAYSWLRVHGVVGDYEQHLDRVPAGERRLWVFLGGTIGNFELAEAAQFLRTLRAEMGPDDHLLLGTDLVKDPAILNAAYNDAAGVTADFNRNVLRVLNRELQADFDVDLFEHVAYFDERRSQIEMHLRAREPHRVRIVGLQMGVSFTAGETIRTEISRKFTPDGVRTMLREAGLELIDWYTPANQYFGLSLARPS